MKNILLLTNPSCGGAERMTVLFGKILYKAGYSVSLLIYKTSEQDKSDLLAFVPDYIKVDYISCHYRTLFFKLYKYIRSSNVNVVFSSLPLLNFINILVSKLLRRGIKVVIRECNTPSTHKSWIRIVGRLLYRFADLIISQTYDMKQEMISLYCLKQDKVKTIINPVDTELINECIKEPYDFPTGLFKYVAVGRLHPQKGYDTLLNAFADLLELYPDSCLFIVGDDRSDYASQQKKLVNDLGISAKVFFTGFQSNPYKYLNKADCFVLSSNYEGLPNVLLDAVYLGVPVVATNSISFISDTLKNSSLGICVPVKSVKQLSDALIEIRTRTRYSGLDLSKESSGNFVRLIDQLFA